MLRINDTAASRFIEITEIYLDLTRFATYNVLSVSYATFVHCYIQLHAI